MKTKHFKTVDYGRLTEDEKDGFSAYVQLVTGKHVIFDDDDMDYYFFIEHHDTLWAVSTMAATGYEVIPFEELKRMAALGMHS